MIAKHASPPPLAWDLTKSSRPSAGGWEVDRATHGSSRRWRSKSFRAFVKDPVAGADSAGGAATVCRVYKREPCTTPRRAKMFLLPAGNLIRDNLIIGLHHPNIPSPCCELRNIAGRSSRSLRQGRCDRLSALKSFASTRRFLLSATWVFPSSTDFLNPALPYRSGTLAIC